MRYDTWLLTGCFGKKQNKKSSVFSKDQIRMFTELEGQVDACLENKVLNEIRFVLFHFQIRGRSEVSHPMMSFL